jgi:hypothetical protein
MKRLILLFAAMSLFLFGCGSGNGAGSSTNGSLTLSDLAVTIQPGGTFLVTGTATYLPPIDKVPNGAQINISANLVTKTFSNTATLDSTGVVQISYSAPQPSSPGVVMVDASIGDLKVHKEATIAALVL